MSSNNYNYQQITKSYIINHCNNLILDLDGNAAEINSGNSAFYNKRNLQQCNLINFYGTPNLSYVFGWCNNLTNLDVSNGNMSNVTNLGNAFYDCDNLINLNVSNGNTSNVTNLSHIFEHCSKLTNLDVSNGNTNKVTNLYAAFSHCNNLINLNLSNGNINQAIGLEGTFASCLKLQNLNIANGDTKNIKSLYVTFDSCRSLINLNLSNGNMSNVFDLNRTFNGCYSLTNLDISNGDVNNVTNLQCTFRDCHNLTTLDVSKGNTSKVTSLGGIFEDCYNLKTLNISNGNISNATSLSFMFAYCNNLTTLNLLNGNINNIKDLNCVFNNTGKRGNSEQSVYGLDFNGVQNGNFSNVTNMNGFLSNAKCGYFPLYNINNIQPYINTGLPNIYGNTNNVTDISGAFAFEGAGPQGNQEQPEVYKKNGYGFPSNSISSNGFFNFSNVKNAVGTFSANSYYFGYEWDGEGVSLSGADYGLYLNNTENIINAKNMFAISFSSGGYPPDQGDEYSDAPTFNIQNTILNFSNVSDASYLFYNYQPVNNSDQWYGDTSVEVMAKKPLPTLILNNIINLYQAYYNTRTTIIDTTYGNLSKVTNIAQAFTLSFALDNASLKNIANALLTATNLSADKKNLFTNNTISPFYLPDPSTTGYFIDMMINNATVGTSLVSQLRAAGGSVPE